MAVYNKLQQGSLCTEAEYTCPNVITAIKFSKMGSCPVV